ncbi:beta-ketoacyl-ACP synthase II [Pleionea mediterranea]|uniref:3-oxoacyl-[acyl-carrier-protein] synthase 2 n=1 Tax=Pleionea mediterranea TaxID=523701 RepID=A0A316FM66_9GAMM|nr:beta-ketoacyl-ACP synthase II [Pleionea mediterranea]PWK49275.1 3-oxoacyl-[acyl-carrier-protein] synthase II [Pleionea mediterranea]
MNGRRVVVTGLGMLSPLGLNVEDTWSNLVAGKSGVGPIESFDASEFNTRFSASVKGFDATEYMSPKDARKFDPFIQYGIAASVQALKDSGVEINESNADRIGVCVGSGIGGLSATENNILKLHNSGPRKVSPFYVPGSIINMISGQLSIMYGLKGPNISIVTACTTGVHSIGHAARMIAYGDADVMVAGGAEMATCPIGVAGFSAAKALSTNNDAPQQASRPWDKDRDGFVLGDGAGVVVLEDYDSAKARNANIYAELTGFGMSGDAHHMTAPPEDGAGAASAMTNALNDAKLNADQVGYINAHGTSTKVGDLAECLAIKSVMKQHADSVMVSSTKSAIGHLLGAAGSVEAIFSILALRDQVAPPTINLDQPDEGCDLDFVPHEAKQASLNHVLCNSFGFGGTNGSLLFSKLS